MYPVENNNNSNSPSKEDFTDPVRSFGMTIADPESFLRYLRQEESHRLGKQSWTQQNHVLPKSRFVQMQIMAESDSKEREPIFNMVVEQDDKMDRNSFMDFMEQLSVLPAHSTSQSKSKGAYVSELKLQKQQNKPLVPQHKLEQSNEVQKHEHYENNVIKQRLIERKFSVERERKVTPKELEVELEHSQTEQPQRKANWRQRERHYYENFDVAEPLSVMGVFGQRISNLSRPSTTQFYNPKSYNILMSPSLHLLPPAVSTSRYFSLPQNIPTFPETPLHTPRNMGSSRIRKRPMTPSRPVVSRPSTDIPPRLIYPLQAYNEIVPKTANISLITTDLPQVSNDIDRRLTDVSFPDTDISHVHVDIPRIYKGVSRSRADVSTPSSVIAHTPPFDDVSHTHILLSQQQSNPSSSPASFPSAKSPDGLEDSLSLNGFALSRESTTVSHKSIETSQSIDSSRQFADFSPKSAGIIPPLPPTFTEIPARNDKSRLTEEFEGNKDIFITNNATYNSYQNEALGGLGEINEQESNGYKAPSLKQSADPVARNIKNFNLSLMATYLQKGSVAANAYNPYTKAGDETQIRRKPNQQPARNHIHPEDKYNEVQLTVAETAYYKRRRLTRKPFTILETTGECTQ
jgi:hypothetical protein